MPGLGVDLHPYYQRGVTSLPGVEYGWLKLADGTRAYTFTDGGRTYTPAAHANLFKALRIPFGGYVYAQPGDGALEARVLWALCQQYGATGVAPACDIESNAKIYTWSTAEARDHGRAFCSQMRALGVRPAIYMSDSLAGQTDPAGWPENPVLWIARYGAKPAQTRYDVHQYDDRGSLPGSAGLVDWNQAYTTAHLTPQEEDMALTDADAQLVAKHIWYDPIWSGPNPDGTTRWQMNASQVLDVLNRANQAEAAKVDALIATVAKLSTDPGITVDVVRQIVTDAVKQNIQITGDVHIGPAATPAGQ